MHCGSRERPRRARNQCCLLLVVAVRERDDLHDDIVFTKSLEFRFGLHVLAWLWDSVVDIQRCSY